MSRYTDILILSGFNLKLSLVIDFKLAANEVTLTEVTEVMNTTVAPERLRS